MRTSKTSGKPYLGISLDYEKMQALKPEDYKHLLMFKNPNKKEEKHPDYDIVTKIAEQQQIAAVQSAVPTPDDLPF
jgi:hypothetical protein